MPGIPYPFGGRAGPVAAPEVTVVRSDRPASTPTGDLLTRHHHRPERIPRALHRLRDRDPTLARRAHRLRPCLDGLDGVMGFGRHPPGGGAGGRGLESVIGEAGSGFHPRSSVCT